MVTMRRMDDRLLRRFAPSLMLGRSRCSLMDLVFGTEINGRVAGPGWAPHGPLPGEGGVVLPEPGDEEA